jgi:hypothetical protein
MYLHADKDDCSTKVVIDLTTGIELQGVVSADDVTGVYVQYKHRMRADGVIEWFYRNGNLVRERKQGRIQIVTKDN